MNRRVIAVLAAASAASLAACSVELPATPEAPALEAGSAVLPSQSDTILGETFTELTAADAAQDAALLVARVGGDALEIRAAQYKIDKAGGADPSVIPPDMQAVYASASDTWPRHLVGVTVSPEPAAMPIVAIWTQADARSDYQLTEWARMIPSAVLPAMPGQADGAEELALDDDSLDVTPAQAIEAYQKYLNEGAKSEAGVVFADDAYATALFKVRSSLSVTAKKRGGTFKDTAVADLEEAFVFASAEGGALVFVPFDITSAFVVPGAQLQLSKADQAILTGKVKSKVYYHYRDLVVIKLSAPGTGIPPEVVAADHHLLSITVTE